MPGPKAASEIPSNRRSISSKLNDEDIACNEARRPQDATQVAM